MIHSHDLPDLPERISRHGAGNHTAAQAFHRASIAPVGRRGQTVLLVEPLWEWDIAYNVLRDGQRDGVAYDELRQIEGMYLACSGSLQGFQFWDCDDHEVFQQPIATTDGLSSAYTLVRTLGANNPAAGYRVTEAVGFLDLSWPFNLYIDHSSVPVSPTDPVFGYSLSTSAPKQQQIVFNEVPPSGYTLSADLSFLYYARFNMDSQDFEKFMHQLWVEKRSHSSAYDPVRAARRCRNPHHKQPGGQSPSIPRRCNSRIRTVMSASQIPAELHSLSIFRSIRAQTRS